MKRNLELLTIIFLLLGGSAFCQPCTPPVAGSIVGPDSVCLGSTITYTNPTGTPGGFWTSVPTTVATIGLGSGTLMAVGTGHTTITYTVSNACATVSATLTVYVVATPDPISGGDSACLGSGATLVLSDNVWGGSWSSSVSGVATIGSGNGVVNPLGLGTTVITYSVAACTTSMTLTVNPVPSAISGPAAVCKFDSITLSDPTGGGVWSIFPIFDTIVATVVPGTGGIGVVHGKGISGSVDVLYTIPATGCYQYQFVSVSTPPTPIAGTSQVCVGQGAVIADGIGIGGSTWTLSSTGIIDTSMVSVDTIIATGISAGSLTITYTTPSCPYVTQTFTVNPNPSAIYGPTAVCVGATTTLIDTTAGGTWSTGTAGVTVTGGPDSTGIVTTTDTGASALIVYTLPTGCYTTATVYTDTMPPAIIGPTTICQGATSLLSDPSPGGVWSSTNLAIFKVNDTSGSDTGVTAGTVNVSYTMPSGCYQTEPIVIQPPVTPAVTITNNPTGILCSGTVDTLYAAPANGGTPTFQWYLFSVPISGATNDTFSYAPTHGDVIECTMTAHGVCALDYTVTDTFPMNVATASVTPVITITSSTASDTIGTLGQTYTFYSSVVYGGTSPTYQWFRNGDTINGATSSSYTTTIYENDTFYCVVGGNPLCPGSTPDQATSNVIIIYDHLGIKQLTTGGSQFYLFPNPNSGSFTLTGTIDAVTDEDVYYEIANMLGQVVYTGHTTALNGNVKAQIGVDGLSSGAYLLRINTQGQSETMHFVVSR